QGNVFYYILAKKNAFLGNKKKNLGKEKVFYDILERKNAFVGYENKNNIGQENVFYYILERQNAFLGYKNKKTKNAFLGIGVEKGLMFWGVLTGHEKMFDEVGNDSVMKQACFVYTVRNLF
ncbi:unnamed protein product, partial [Porites evermanni]